MAHIHMFCDESGKCHNSPAISFCGYVGNSEQWDKFGLRWKSLIVKWEVPPIHMRAITMPDKDEEWNKVRVKWGDEWETKKDSMLDDFATLIYDSPIICVGATIDCAAFLALPALKKRVGDAHYIAFQWAVLRALEKVEWGESDALMGLLLDDDYEKAVHCYALLRSLKEQHPETKKRISSICFCNDKVFPGVQAADMIAMRRGDLGWASEPKPSPRYLRLTGGGMHGPHLFDAAALTALEEECNE